MSSSTTGIPFRSRSLRKPVSSNNNNTSPCVSSGGVTDGAANVRDGSARTASPTRLPVKGSSSLSITRSTSTRIASSLKSSGGGGGGGAVPPSPTAAAAAPKKTRPLSAILGRSRAESAPQKEANGGSTRDVLNSRPPRTATTRPPISGAARPPSSSGGGPSTRSTSMARPTSSSGVPSGSSSSNSRLARAPTSGHARTKSSITSLTGATTLRPPSQTSVDSGGSSSTGVAATAAAPDRSRPPITRSAAAAAHRRNISASSAITTSTTSTTSVSARPRQATISSARQPPPPADPVSTTSDNPPPHRPAFSTLQQHYSPAKSLAPKPLTSTYLAPPSPSKLPSNVALSAEISRLQTELLQLHLLHRDAHAVTGQWRSSAKHKLGDRFANTVKLEQQVGKIEESVVETENLRALVDWGSSSHGGGGGGLESKIQMLDEIVCGLWALGEQPGGRYTRVVRRFEKWASRVKEVTEARKLFDRVRAGEGDGQQVTNELLGDEGLADLLLLSNATEETGGAKKVILLDAEWKEECAMLVRRLTEWRRMLKGLMIVSEEDDTTTAATKNGTSTVVVATESSSSSSLARILKACRSLVHDMLAELDLMEQMERDAVAAENAWVRAVNRDEDEHGDEILPLRRGGMSNNTRAGAIWRAF
ncbi:hypothetical protein V8F06_000807 [Rhypophila decipiens]